MEPPFDLEHLCELTRAGAHPKFLFFWGHTEKAGTRGRECLSQWFPASFCVDGVDYPSAEHYMMAEKARLFGDQAIAEQVLVAPSPAVAKKLGRAVRGFSEDVWVQERTRIVVAGSRAKFEQNPELRAYLLGTGRRVLVEASPRDRVWGIGWSASNPAACQPERWRGLNLLGFALMAARRMLSDASSASG